MRKLLAHALSIHIERSEPDSWGRYGWWQVGLVTPWGVIELMATKPASVNDA